MATLGASAPTTSWRSKDQATRMPARQVLFQLDEGREAVRLDISVVSAHDGEMSRGTGSWETPWTPSQGM